MIWIGLLACYLCIGIGMSLGMSDTLSKSLGSSYSPFNLVKCWLILTLFWPIVWIIAIYIFLKKQEQ